MIDAFVKRLPWLGGVDAHMKEVLRGSAVAITLKVLGAGLSFVLNILLARLLGADGTGVYFLGLTVITVATMFGQLGLGNALLRFTAAHASQEEWTRVAGVSRQGLAIAGAISATVSMAVLAGAPAIAHYVYSEPALTAPLRLMALAIVPLTLLSLYADLLKGLKRIAGALLVNTVAIPLISMPFLAVLAGTWGVSGAAIAYLLATILVLGLGAVLWRRATPQVRGLRGSFDTRLLLSTSIPLFWVALMNLVMSQTDVVLLGVWGDSSLVGIYGTAARTSSLTSFVLLAMISISAPKFAALYAQEDFGNLESLARNVARLGTLVASVVILPLVLAPSWILGLFGPEFVAGRTVLIILAAGQFVNVATGPVGLLLLMTGHEKIQRNNSILSAALNVLLGVILVPTYGLTGAAVATASTLAFKNLNTVRLVQKYLGIKVWSWGQDGGHKNRPSHDDLGRGQSGG
ncbi:MAG: flippase [Anaerolineae bacterium]